MRVIVILLLTSLLAFSQTNSTEPTNNNSKNIAAPIIDSSDDKDDSENQEDLFDLLFSDAKSFYVEALISGFYRDTTEVKYCFDRTFEIVAEISELDTLTSPQKDELTRFCEKLTFDYQNQFSYMNGDTGTTGVAFIRNYISEKVIDTVKVGEDELIVLDDRPGHLPIVTSKKIDRIVSYLSGSQGRHFQVWLDNAGLYKDLMLPIIRQHGLPEELFYLALIESGFNTSAYSYAHAAGPWQFIAGTGARYGLKRNWWVDERRDPIKSTEAAASYLKDLYEQFDDWFLAMAAYNCGEMNVWRAIRREGTRDFWKLKTLPRQTRDYIPTFMAGIIIAQNPEKFGFTNTPKDTWKWEEVVVDRSYEFEHISKVADVSVPVLKQFNPELRRWVTPPEVESYVLRVPVNKSQGLLEKLHELPPAEQPKPEWQTHRVRKGQTLNSIANHYGTTVSALISANNITNKNRLRVGQTIRIPTDKYYAPPKYKAPAPVQNKITYVVKRGDTLTKIASRYNVTIAKIRTWNHISTKKAIYPGQRLVIYRHSDS